MKKGTIEVLQCDTEWLTEQLLVVYYNCMMGPSEAYDLCWGDKEGHSLTDIFIWKL